MKRFLLKLSYTVLPLWLLTMTVTGFYKLKVEPEMNGELGPLGKLVFPVEHKDNVDITTKYYTDCVSLEELTDTVVDVLTLGDSFSQQWLGSYENFIARDGFSTVNLHVAMNMFQTAYDLMKLGYVDSTHVKTIIIESCERFTVERILKLSTLDTAVTVMPINTVRAVGEDDTSRNNPLIETRNWILLRLGIKHPVRHARVNRELFSGGDGRDLYFLDEDLYQTSISPAETVIIKRNIGLINNMADSLGIKIVYLVPPDKYTVYQQYITNNPFPLKTVGKQLKTMMASDNVHVWVFGIDVVSQSVETGEKDVYPVSATHWNWSTSERVASTISALITRTR